ncbi:hypothetical protein HRG84_24175 [Flavisolibacter sp. BT320]|nr:hypothetical protein [Flavisolibacter longurius]
MKVIVVTLLFFISNFSVGQGLNDTIQNKLQFFNVSSDNLRLLAGSYTTSNGLGGFTYHLDSSGVFKREDVADLGGRSFSTKGTYRQNANKQVELSSKKDRSTYNVFFFDKFAFLVNAESVGKFQEDFRKTVLTFGKKVVHDLGNETYTAEYIIAYSLALDGYLVKGCD